MCIDIHKRLIIPLKWNLDSRQLISDTMLALQHNHILMEQNYLEKIKKNKIVNRKHTSKEKAKIMKIFTLSLHTHNSVQ